MQSIYASNQPSFRGGGGVAPALSLTFTTSLDARVTFTRATMGTYFDSAGVLQTAAIDTPRFDYNPATLVARGLLVEEARTNLLLQSNALGTTWTAVGTGTRVQDTTGIDGATSAWTLSDTSAGSRYEVVQAHTLTAATYTSSAYVKKTVGAQSSYPVIYAYTGSTGAFVTIDTTNGIATIWTAYTGFTIVTSSARIFDCGAFWRVELTYLATAASWSVVLAPAATSNATQSTGTMSVALTGAAVMTRLQTELGAFATSPIDTTTATVTRSADVATMTGTNFSSWYNQSAGTFVVGADSLTLSSVGWLLTVSDGTSNNRFGQYRSGANLGGYVVTATVTQMDLTLASVVANTPFKASVAAISNSGNIAFNGAIAAGDAIITMPTLNKLEIGANNGAVYNGHIRSLTYYNTRLPDAQLQSLTA